MFWQQCEERPAVTVAFVDTLHLFDETYSFLRELEDRYNFKALYFTPKDFKTTAEYQKVHGVDLPIRDIELCVPESFCSLAH
jgi:3'-phosphoadenosine 5'-phosphosulfate sulfotransferase (PAPS reductase)/FAD synthetase